MLANLLKRLGIAAASSGARHTAQDLSTALHVLRHAPQGAFLLVRPAGGQDFLQVQQDPPGLRLSFPQTTRRQRTQRRPFEVACLTRGLRIEHAQEADGSLFLETRLTGSDEASAAHILGLVWATFGATREAALDLEAEGFVLPSLR